MSAVLSSPIHQSLPRNNPLLLFPSPTVDFITISGQIQPELLTFMGKTFILIQYKSYLGGWGGQEFFPSTFLSVCLPLFPPPPSAASSRSLPLLDSQAYVMWKVSSLKQLEDTEKPFPFSEMFFSPCVEYCHSTFPRLSVRKSLQVLKGLDPLFQTYSQRIKQ